MLQPSFQSIAEHYTEISSRLCDIYFLDPYLWGKRNVFDCKQEVSVLRKDTENEMLAELISMLATQGLGLLSPEPKFMEICMNHKQSKMAFKTVFGVIVSVGVPLTCLPSKIYPYRHISHRYHAKVPILLDMGDSFIDRFVDFYLTERRIERIKNIIANNLSIEMLASSRSHLNSAAEILTSDAKDTKSVIDSLFSIEMSIKAYMVALRGWAESDCRSVSHDIKDALEKIQSVDQSIAAESALKELLNIDFKLKGFVNERYRIIEADENMGWIAYNAAMRLLSIVTESLSRHYGTQIDSKIDISPMPVLPKAKGIS
ncbi:hypothetical protein [Pseudomonas amygdali]|uniref:PhoU domain-containing protein n=2 Tax=Pseudomonas amygdali pv. lachrymans TaxID=53707 RepID=A0ABR5KRQ4_PSEAV|nr:hypothetical protein [Pseudomonas amygdali]AXH59863.1 hypothetical protein PLA107_032070 [Pseudomonas amygdali pv. lachrymans str. M301315]KPC17277.1 Uncharacterized protein AC499_0479 [Pseudomonas amygdali pv. lachrymans]RMT06407.1 hypothetical protein ALP54_03741 [Pseudomonas amygdali pv. lachrymans]